ncbi:hypothetical protein ACFV7Q_10895 [Streptomyces sp. NPDC059851]|uniref:hypothetical protein n=1 Tax=Streptomyces sp. NPDC059851 TaxID=3346971 RepID=UPI00365A56FC
MSGDADHTATKLNGVDGAPASPPAPGGGSIFGSTPAEKNTAANTIETELEPNTKKATDSAKENTSAAAQSLDGWATASGLKKVAETWDQQAKALMGRLSAEKASLRSTSGLFVRNDVRTGDELRALGPKSKLEGL